MTNPQEENQQNLIKSPKSNSLLTALKDTTILTTQDWKNLDDAKEFINDCFTTVPMYRPLPVKLFGVLNDASCPTPESKFWQCKVEAEVHADQLIEDIHNLELLRINLERSEYTLIQQQKRFEIEPDKNRQTEIEFDIREQKVLMSRLEYKAIKLQKQIKYRIDEVHEWNKISSTLSESHTGIETKNYVKQYVNSMRNKLISSSNKTNDEKEKKTIQAQVGSFDKIIQQMETLKSD